MNHTLNTPSASWSVARFPKEVQNYAPTVKEPAMFSALRNGGGNVALNAYAAQAVVAWMKGEHADMPAGLLLRRNCRRRMARS